VSGRPTAPGLSQPVDREMCLWLAGGLGRAADQITCINDGHTIAGQDAGFRAALFERYAGLRPSERGGYELRELSWADRILATTPRRPCGDPLTA
jgi:hypothetical protein